jgi:hypothetical protein
MYPIEIFLAILVIDGVLSIYSIMDKGSGSYREMLGFSNIVNIIALGFATFLSVYLALVSVSGTASLNGIPVMDDGLMWIFIVIAVIQGVFVLMELLEAYAEHLAGKEEKGNLIS